MKLKIFLLYIRYNYSIFILCIKQYIVEKEKRILIIELEAEPILQNVQLLNYKMRNLH